MLQAKVRLSYVNRAICDRAAVDIRAAVSGCCGYPPPPSERTPTLYSTAQEVGVVEFGRQ